MSEDRDAAKPAGAAITPDELARARTAVPPGSATLTGTMTTVTPAAAFVGLFNLWVAPHWGLASGADATVFEMVLATSIAHGIKFLADAAWPRLFGAN